MPDQRPIHRHAASLYGPNGPVNDLGQPSPRPMTTTLRLAKAPPGPCTHLGDSPTRGGCRSARLQVRPQAGHGSESRKGRTHPTHDLPEPFTGRKPCFSRDKWVTTA